MPPHKIKAHLARLLSSVVSCDRCVIYDIGEDLIPSAHTAHDGETRWVRPYENVLSIDPMRPELHVKSATSLIVTGWNYPDERLYRSDYYEAFMRACGQRHKAELFFRNRWGRLIGGARLARPVGAGPFAPHEITRLQLMQPVIESHMNWLALLGLEDRTGPFAKLSDREWEVVRLAAAGLPNKKIGDRHGTSLPTIKSQLGSAFRKLSVRNRAELMALFFAGRERHH
jgi:DNA-binding CsgD family transcriptional regulator